MVCQFSHRSHGSTGQCQDPGKVFKGKKMAGHMGAKRVTIQNLLICDVDKDLGLIIVKGAIPGSKNSVVLVKDAVKKVAFDGVPMPAGLSKKASDASSPKGAVDADDNKNTKDKNIGADLPVDSKTKSVDGAEKEKVSSKAVAPDADESKTKDDVAKADSKDGN